MPGTMDCANCGEYFKRYEKSYRRKSIFTVKEKEYLDDVFGTRITPIFGKKDIFICPECFKLLKIACVGASAKHKLFSRTKSGSYVSVKRKLVTELHTPDKKMKLSPMPDSTPCPPQSTSKEGLSTGPRYFNRYKYKAGFQYYLNRFKGARRALHKILVKTTRKEVSILLKQPLPITQDISLEAFSSTDWATLTSLTQMYAPVLYHVLVGAMTYQGKEDSLVRGSRGSCISLKPVMGCIISQILVQLKPKRLRLFKTKHILQMWRAGSKLAKESQLKDMRDASPDETEEDEDSDDTDEAEEMDSDMGDQNGIDEDEITEDEEELVNPELSEKELENVKKQTKQKGSKGKGRRDASPDELEEGEDNDDTDEAEQTDSDNADQTCIEEDEPTEEEDEEIVKPQLSKKELKKEKKQTKPKESQGKGKRDASAHEMEENEDEGDANETEEMDIDLGDQNGIDEDEPTEEKKENSVKPKLIKEEPKVKKRRLNKGKKPGSYQSHVSHQPATGPSATVTTPSSHEKEQHVSEESVKFVGRQVLHEWEIDVKTKETKWYTGYVTNVLKGKDGDAEAVYEILYEGEEVPMECELLQDFLDGTLKFKDVIVK